MIQCCPLCLLILYELFVKTDDTMLSCMFRNKFSIQYICLIFNWEAIVNCCLKCMCFLGNNFILNSRKYFWLSLSTFLFCSVQVLRTAVSERAGLIMHLFFIREMVFFFVNSQIIIFALTRIVFPTCSIYWNIYLHIFHATFITFFFLPIGF